MGHVKMAGPGFVNDVTAWWPGDDSCHLYSSIVPSIHFVPFNVRNSKRNWAKFGLGVKLIVILRHMILYDILTLNVYIKKLRRAEGGA
jgi:hypothetical protein